MKIKGPTYVDFTKQNRTEEQAREIFRQRLMDASEIFQRYSGEFKTRVCPICGDYRHHELEPFHSQYGIAECDTCRTTYVNPCPSLTALDYYYNNCKCNAQLGQLVRSRVKTNNIILSERTSFVIDLINNLLENRDRLKMLEVGCSSGAFLSELNDAIKLNGLADKVDLCGVDIDEESIQLSVDQDLSLRQQRGIVRKD